MTGSDKIAHLGNEISFRLYIYKLLVVGQFLFNHTKSLPLYSTEMYCSENAILIHMQYKCTGVQNPLTTSTDTRTVKHNTTQQKSNCNYDRGWGSKNPCLKIIIQEDGCGQRVKQDRVVLLIDSILEKLTHEEM